MLTNEVHGISAVYEGSKMHSVESRLPVSGEAISPETYNFLKGFQWMLTMSSAILILCGGAMLALLVAVAGEAYISRRNGHALEEIKQKYFDKLQSACSEDFKDMETDEIGQYIGYEPRKWKDWEMLQWYSVFMEISGLAECDGHNYSNVRRAMNLVGFTDYVEHQLESGKTGMKRKMMEAVLVTNMELPDELAATLYNVKDAKLRKASGIYRMCVDNINPYTYLKQEREKGEVFTEWDIMQLYEFYRRANNGNRRFLKPKAEKQASGHV